MPRRKKIDINLDGMAKLMGAEISGESTYYVWGINVVGRGETVAKPLICGM